MRSFVAIVFATFFLVSQASAGPVPSDTTPPSAPGTPTDGGVTTASTSVTWTWSASTDSESSITTYKIDIGTTPGGADVVNQATTNGQTSYTQTGLLDGYTYYARVRATNSVALTGDYSANSDGILIDTSAPTFSSLEGTVTGSTAAISWATSEASTSQVRYGTVSGSYPTATSLSSLLVASHHISISGLASGTYFYQALSNDGVGNAGTSSEATFTISSTSSSSPSPTTTTTSSSPSASATTSSAPTSRATSSSPTASPSVKTTTAKPSASPSSTATLRAVTSTSPSASASATPLVAAFVEKADTPIAPGWPGWLSMFLLTIAFFVLLYWFLWAHHGHHHHQRGEKPHKHF